MEKVSRLPSIEEFKDQAKRLRKSLAQAGTEVGHSKSLELVAQQFGFKDWNTLHAARGNQGARRPFALGDRVLGSYLKQPFRGEVVGIRSFGPGMVRITIHFDEPVDVVIFDSFSAFRQRVSGIINEDGLSPEKTSDGVPQLIVRRDD